jgi:hypothetical protein
MTQPTSDPTVVERRIAAQRRWGRLVAFLLLPPLVWVALVYLVDPHGSPWVSLLGATAMGSGGMILAVVAIRWGTPFSSIACRLATILMCGVGGLVMFVLSISAILWT